MHDLEARFLNLEKSHRRLQRACAAMVLTGMGIALLAAQRGADDAAKTLRCQRLEVINDKGQVAVVLDSNTTTDSGIIETYGAKGEKQIALSENNESGGRLVLFNGGLGKVGMGAKQTCGTISTYNKEGNFLVDVGMNQTETAGSVTVNNSAGKRVAGITVAADGRGEIMIVNDNNQEQVKLMGTESGGQISTYNAQGAEQTWLGTQGVAGTIRLFDQKGTLVCGAGANDKGDGTIAAFNKSGVSLVTIGSNPDSGTGSISTFGPKGEEVTRLGTQGAAGTVRLFDQKGTLVFGAGANDAGVGVVSTFDAKGIELARIYASGNGDGLVSVYNRAGKEAVAAGSTDDGSGGLSTYGADGKERIRLSNGEAGGEMRLFGPGERPAVLLRVDPAKGGTADLFDAKGEPKAGGS